MNLVREFQWPGVSQTGKINECLLLNFFNAIKNRVGTFKPKWFMSNLAEQSIQHGH